MQNSSLVIRSYAFSINDESSFKREENLLGKTLLQANYYYYAPNIQMLVNLSNWNFIGRVHFLVLDA